MASQVDNQFRTFQASGALPAFTVVDVNAAGLMIAGTNLGQGVGVVQQDVADLGYGSVKLWGGGSFKITVSGIAVTPGVEYTLITGGYVGSTATPGMLTALGSSSNVTAGPVVEFVKYFGYP